MNSVLEMLEPSEEKPAVSGWRLALGYIGFFCMLIGIVLLVPSLTVIFYHNEAKYLAAFLIPGFSFIAAGAVPFFLFSYRKRHAQLAGHQDAFIVVTCWIIAILACAIPFAATGYMNFHQAFFESASGITTTGLTVVSDFEGFPRILFILRATTHFVGGIGLILIMISVLSDRYGMKLYASEGHYDRFLPNLLKSSRTILLIYCGFIVAGIVGYVCCGMSVFDAICHSIAAVATGGFSTKAKSIGAFNSLPIECVSIVLMICGSINFLAYVFLLRGKFKNFFLYCENKCMVLLFAVLIPLASMGLFYGSSLPLGQSWRLGSFQVISALTTTGYQTMDLVAGVTPSIIFIILTLCMLVGGQSNSTSGGFKIYRLNMLVKSFYIKIRESQRRSMTLRSYRVTQLDEKTGVSGEMVSENNTFVGMWFFIYFIGVVVFCLFGLPLDQSMLEVASCIGTSGLSSGGITAQSPVFLLYFASLIMFLGRLEIFVVIFGFIYAVRAPLGAVRQWRLRRREV